MTAAGAGDRPGPEGLGGWLVVVGLGLVLGPFHVAAQLWPMYSQIFATGYFDELWRVGSEAHSPQLALFIVAEIGVNLLMLAAGLVAAVLYFRKHRAFPMFFIGVEIGSLILMTADAIVGGYVLDEAAFDPDTAKEIGRALVGSMIWVPYMLVSRRVKNTFVHGGRATQPVLADAPA